MDPNKVLAVLREIETYSAFAGTVAKDETKVCTYCSGFNKHYDDCKLAALISELEHEAREPKDWQSTVGMFTGDTAMMEISEETRKVRERSRAEAQAEPGGWKPGTEPPSDSRYVLAEFLNPFGVYFVAIDRFKNGKWDRDGAITRWHEIPPRPPHDQPPLPEEKPKGNVNG